jgi:hypothetical protein
MGHEERFPRRRSSGRSHGHVRGQGSGFKGSCGVLRRLVRIQGLSPRGEGYGEYIGGPEEHKGASVGPHPGSGESACESNLITGVTLYFTGVTLYFTGVTLYFNILQDAVM